MSVFSSIVLAANMFNSSLHEVVLISITSVYMTVGPNFERLFMYYADIILVFSKWLGLLVTLLI